MTLSGALKWAFKIAVLGVGVGIGSELLTEFLTYGMMHGSLPISTELASMSKEFTEPIMHWLNGAIGGEAGLGWLKGLLKGTHEFFGVHNTFQPHVLAAPAVEAVKSTLGVLVPGL